MCFVEKRPVTSKTYSAIQVPSPTATFTYGHLSPDTTKKTIHKLHVDGLCHFQFSPEPLLIQVLKQLIELQHTGTHFSNISNRQGMLAKKYKFSATLLSEIISIISQFKKIQEFQTFSFSDTENIQCSLK